MIKNPIVAALREKSFAPRTPCAIECLDKGIGWAGSKCRKYTSSRYLLNILAKSRLNPTRFASMILAGSSTDAIRLLEVAFVGKPELEWIVLMIPSIRG